MSESDQRTAPQGALESAASFLRGSVSADGSAARGRTRSEQIQWQFDKLYRWARDSGLLGDARALKYARRGGQEHRLLHDAHAGRFRKFTFPGRAGVTFTVQQAGLAKVVALQDATPLEYLERLILQNDIFADDVQFEAVTIHDGMPCIQTSQPFIAGTTPGEDEIQSVMQDLGFLRSPHGAVYYREEDRIIVWDAHCGNFVQSAGIAVPIDVICQRATEEALELLGF